MKKLGKAEARFTVKKVDRVYRVYDRARGSFPYQLPELGGVIAQDGTEEEMLEEAGRLEKLFGSGKSIQAEQNPAAASSAVVTSPNNQPEIEDYGVMSEEDRAAYEDGLMEKVKY